MIINGMPQSFGYTGQNYCACNNYKNEPQNFKSFCAFGLAYWFDVSRRIFLLAILLI
jgi:hypothetical protein